MTPMSIEQFFIQNDATNLSPSLSILSITNTAFYKHAFIRNQHSILCTRKRQRPNIATIPYCIYGISHLLAHVVIRLFRRCDTSSIFFVPPPTPAMPVANLNSSSQKVSVSSTSPRALSFSEITKALKVFRSTTSLFIGNLSKRHIPSFYLR